MNTNNTFLNIDYDRLIDEFKKINEDRKNFIEKRKARHHKTIEILSLHVKNI